MDVINIAAPILVALLTWWFSTGAILWLDRLPRKTFAWSFAAMSVVAGAALFSVVQSAGVASAMNAYVAFVCAIAIWGWHEMSFLMGFITGPRRQDCPPDARGWRRFMLATATLIHHEIALALTGVALVALTWGQPNQIATITFAALWAMRLSTKFNLFLGAAHRSEEMLPEHLLHLKSYFGARRMSALFPASLTAGALLIWALGVAAFSPEATPYQQTGFSLVLALAALGLLEHLFLFVGPPNAMLWGWASATPGADRPR